MRRLLTLLAVLVVLTGCGHAAQKPSAATRSGSASPTPSPTPTPGVPICGVPDLRLSVPGADGAAGTQYAHLTFRNVSSRTCVMDGHPGVSFYGSGAGGRIGAPADRFGSLKRVVLPPGGTTSAVLEIPDVGSVDTCKREYAAGLQVFPPGSQVSVYVPFRIQVCADLDRKAYPCASPPSDSSVPDRR